MSNISMYKSLEYDMVVGSALSALYAIAEIGGRTTVNYPSALVSVKTYSARLSYQQRIVIADNVLSSLNGSWSCKRFNPFSWGTIYTHFIVNSEVSVLDFRVLSHCVGHFFKYFVYWLRLPHKSVQLKDLKDFLTTEFFLNPCFL